MGARTILLVVAVVLVLGYLFYGRFIARRLGVDPERKTPAHTKFDGVDFVPARHWLVLFGHHFSSICAAGPIVGPALAVAYWGWAPSLLWILVGGVLLGAVADFSSLVAAVRHGGVSISEVTAQAVSKRARLLFSLFIFITLILVLAVFADLTAATFITKPEIVVPSWGILPIAAVAGVLLYRGAAGSGRLVGVTLGGLGLLVGLMLIGHWVPIDLAGLFGGDQDSAKTVWILLLLAYCFVASVIPVQFLLQPRDYLSSYVLFAIIAIGLFGALYSGPEMQATAFVGFTSAGGKPLWPMLFVTIACGAISGFHSVVASGTTCKQLPNEAHACRIGYGAMLLESLVAVLVVLAVGAGLTAGRHHEILATGGSAVVAFGEGYGGLTQSLLGEYGTPLAIMGLNFFILTTLDTATRLGRYLLHELTGIENRYLPTMVVVGLTAALALTGQWQAIWPMFGASNQLVAALALLVVACWLLQRGRRILPILIPSMLMLVTTVGALVWQISDALAVVDDAGVAAPNYLLVVIHTVLLFLALFVLAEAWKVLRVGRQSRPA